MRESKIALLAKPVPCAWLAVLLTAGSPLAGMSSLDRATAQERIRTLSALATKYPWFGRQKEAILSKCESRLGPSDEDLWRDMPGQCIPRRTMVNTEHGCPNCGKAVHRGYGYYPWRSTPAHPWKVQCPKCLERFPKNDFLAYYRSGIDEQGSFDAARADKSLLHNQEHPDPADPKHKFGVDPGAGYRSPEGNVYTFVACYNLSRIWGKPWDKQGITSVALDFAYAYLLTGDVRYARKAAVILARIATLYPEMDYGFWTGKPEYNPLGRRIPGKILDRIWENILVRRLLRTYDLVHDAVVADQSFRRFLAQRTAHLPLSGATKEDRFTSLVAPGF